MNTTENFTQELNILNYILITTTTSIIVICMFWLWYYISSVYINKREVAKVNKNETTNVLSRLWDLKSQRIKNYLFIAILTFEMIRKILALVEYFYVANLGQKYHQIEIPSNHAGEKKCPEDMHEIVMKHPILILMHSLNLTATLCLVSLVGIAMLYLSKMYKGDRKLTSVHALVIVLAIKAVLVLILSSTVFLHVAGYFVWLFCLIIDWFLILAFAMKLNNTVSGYKRNNDIPQELKVTANKRSTREYRMIGCVSVLITCSTLLYIVAQVIGVSIDIADIVILRPCFFRKFGIWVADSNMREVIDFIRAREAAIAAAYTITFLFEAAIITMHFFFLFRHGRKIVERLLCKQQQQVLSYDKKELEEPLLNDNARWTDEAFVRKVEGSSLS